MLSTLILTSGNVLLTAYLILIPSPIFRQNIDIDLESLYAREYATAAAAPPEPKTMKLFCDISMLLL